MFGRLLGLATLKRSITTRMLVVSGVLVLTFVAVFALLVHASVEQRGSARLAFRSQEAIASGNKLEKLVIDLETGVRGFVASGGRNTFLQPWTQARRQYPTEAATLAHLVRDHPDQARMAAEIKSAMDDYVNLYSLPMIALARERPEVAKSVIVNGTGKDRVAGIRGEFSRLFTAERSLVNTRETRAENRSKTAIALGIAGLGFAIVAVILLGLYLARSIVRPVRRVAAGAERVAGGDLSARVPDARADELGDLGRAFNTMAASLEESRDEIDRRTRDLERSNRELAQYAAVTSHDLKEPLQTVSLFAQLFERRYKGRLDPQADQYIDSIISGTEHMRTLIRDLLEYSRVGRGEVRRETVDGEVVFQKVLDNLDASISERGAEITHDPLPSVEGDPNQIGQVLQNLISNGLKFNAEGAPRVHVSASRDSGFVLFSVADNGIGIDEEHAHKIFEPFARVGERYEGTGIGLAICHKIVERHGGRIWVESRPGEGSTFKFTVPAASGRRSAPAAAPEKAPTPA